MLISPFPSADGAVRATRAKPRFCRRDLVCVRRTPRHAESLSRALCAAPLVVGPRACQLARGILEVLARPGLRVLPAESPPTTLRERGSSSTPFRTLLRCRSRKRHSRGASEGRSRSCTKRSRHRPCTVRRSTIDCTARRPTRGHHPQPRRPSSRCHQPKECRRQCRRQRFHSDAEPATDARKPTSATRGVL